MSLFAGVDGGQSSTVAVVGDDAGRVLGRGTGPAADLVGVSRDAARQAAALRDALDDALARAGLPGDSRFAAVVAGISGFEPGASHVPDLSDRTALLRVVHDGEIAYAGALGGAPGVVVIAGTGSVALGSSGPGRPFVRAGGWGPLFGDEGSALWIALAALRGAMRDEDRGTPSPLGARLLAELGLASLRDLQLAAAHGERSRAQIAALARHVLAAATAGEPSAAAIRSAAAGALAELAALVAGRLETAAERISHVGGLFADAGFRAAFAEAAHRAVPAARVRQPLGDGADGAFAIARRVAGGPR